MRALCLGCFLCFLCLLQVVGCVFAICLECYGNPFAMLLQFVRHAFAIRLQRNGRLLAAVGDRFIVPEYMKTPTKWGKKMRVWWNECVYLIMWICVFNETDTRFWLRQDTGAMNRPLRLADCSLRISWVYVGISRIVCWHFVECSPRNWQTVRSRRGRFIVPAYMKTPTKWRTEMCVRWNEYTYLIM